MNLDDYNGTLLNVEIKKRFNRAASHTTQADYIKTACKALGFKERLRGDNGSEIENKAILKWLLENKLVKTATLPETAPSIEQPPKPKTRNKTKRESRFNQFKRISFNVTGNTQRQHISLEPEFIKALELIAPANRNQWLSDTVSSWIATNGVESSTRIVKLSIVNELLKRAK